MNEETSALTILLPVMLVLILLSSFFSASETAITSFNIVRLKQWMKNNKKKTKKIKQAKRVYRLVKDYNKTLATILIANTLINTALATIGTAFFSVWILKESSLTIISTLVVGMVVLIFGEVCPKIIAKRIPEKFAIFAAYPLLVWKVILYPLTWFLNLLSSKNNLFTTTENELLELISVIESEGVLEVAEKQLIESAIKFDEKTVGSVMSPFDKVYYIYHDITFEELTNVYKTQRYTRMPVVNRHTKTVIGILNIKDVIFYFIDNNLFDLQKVMHEPLFLSRRVKLNDALQKMQQEQKHLAIVISRKNANDFLGIITMEDIVEELVGEIYDEDDYAGQIKRIGNHMYWIQANTPLERVFKELKLKILNKYKDKTIYQWFVDETGFNLKIEDTQDEFIYQSYSFKIDREKINLPLKQNLHHIILEVELLTNNGKGKNELI